MRFSPVPAQLPRYLMQTHVSTRVKPGKPAAALGSFEPRCENRHWRCDLLHTRNASDRVQLLFLLPGVRLVIRNPSDSGCPQSAIRRSRPATAMRFLGEPFRHDLFVSSGRSDFSGSYDVMW
jgi:hypothetical protein